MSQEIFEVRPGVHCMVGWDVPMQTFFGQVYKVDLAGERTEDELTHWVGTGDSEIRSVAMLARALRPHAVIPADIYKKLYEMELD